MDTHTLIKPIILVGMLLIGMSLQLSAQTLAPIYTGGEDDCSGTKYYEYMKACKQGNSAMCAKAEAEWERILKECQPDGSKVPAPPNPKNDLPRDESSGETTNVAKDPDNNSNACPNRTVWMEAADGRWTFYYCEREPSDCECKGVRQLLWSVEMSQVPSASYVRNFIPVLINKKGNTISGTQHVPFDLDNLYRSWKAGSIDYPNSVSLDSLKRFNCSTPTHGMIQDPNKCGNFANLQAKVNDEYEFRFIVPGPENVWLVSGNGKAKMIPGWPASSFEGTQDQAQNSKIRDFLFNLATIAAKDPNMEVRFSPSKDNLRAFVTGRVDNKPYALGIDLGHQYYLPVRSQYSIDASRHINGMFLNNFRGSLLEQLAGDWHRTGERAFIHAYLPATFQPGASPEETWGNPDKTDRYPNGWANVSNHRGVKFLVRKNDSCFVQKSGSSSKILLPAQEASILRRAADPWLNWLFLADPGTFIFDSFAGKRGLIVVVGTSQPDDLYGIYLTPKGEYSPHTVSVLDFDKEQNEKFSKGARANRKAYDSQDSTIRTRLKKHE